MFTQMLKYFLLFCIKALYKDLVVPDIPVYLNKNK